MRYILRKFVEAATVEEALAKDASTPVHDAYLKEGEEPKGGGAARLSPRSALRCLRTTTAR
jgi:hypothetical protein